MNNLDNISGIQLLPEMKYKYPGLRLSETYNTKPCFEVTLLNNSGSAKNLPYLSEIIEIHSNEDVREYGQDEYSTNVIESIHDASEQQIEFDPDVINYKGTDYEKKNYHLFAEKVEEENSFERIRKMDDNVKNSFTGWFLIIL